jgi:hypothetical protein
LGFSLVPCQKLRDSVFVGTRNNPPDFLGVAPMVRKIVPYLVNVGVENFFFVLLADLLLLGVVYLTKKLGY